jgi:hypothetical protein
MKIPVDSWIVSVKYRIEVFKDGKAVTANFDVRVTDIASTELLSDLRLSVDGQNLTSDFQPGQKEFTGTRQAVLKNPAKDALVSFTVSSNQPWSDSKSDVLRGTRRRDDSLLEN